MSHAKAAAVYRLVVAGRELEVASIPGRRAGVPTLMFLHEGLGSLGLWRDFPALLAERSGCAAVVYSRYGNGFSEVLHEPRPTRYMHDEALVTLPALLSVLGLNDVVLFGHSDGASIAIVFAAEHPGVVRGMVLEAPHLFVEDLSVSSIAAIRQEYAQGTLRERMARRHSDADRTFFGWNDVWLSPQFRGWSVEAEASRVQSPALVLQGTGDEYGTLAQVEAMARLSRGSVDCLTLAACGHAPHRDRAAEVLETSSAWISQLGGALLRLRREVQLGGGVIELHDELS